MKIIRFLFSPLIFSLGFIAPLLAAVLSAGGLAINGIENITIALVIAGLWGVMAQYRGSWVWVKP